MLYCKKQTNKLHFHNKNGMSFALLLRKLAKFLLRFLFASVCSLLKAVQNVYLIYFQFGIIHFFFVCSFSFL